jgi:hypothetical protein
MNPIHIIRDAAYKLRILFWMLCEQASMWHKEVWSSNLDVPYCCTGRDCACEGMTVREVWSRQKPDHSGGGGETRA